MSTTAETRLQALLEEEKVIKATLQQVKSKYLQLQVEHMALSRAQKSVLSKCNANQEHNTDVITSTIEAVSENVNNTSDSEEANLFDIINDEILFDELKNLPLNNVEDSRDNEFSELPVVVEYTNPCANSDEEFQEEDLDDPLVLNQLQLEGSQTALTSEVDSSDESLAE